MAICYEFTLADARTLQFTVDPDRPPAAPPDAADWIRLETRKCPNCPLPADAAALCPTAVAVHPLIAGFGDLISHGASQVRVDLGHRAVVANSDVQTALSSLLGLIMASSDCPILSRLKGLARLHLPFQSMEEVQFRLVGAWLLGRLVDGADGAGDPLSLEGLNALIEEVNVVNRAFMHRLRLAAKEDASWNALAMLAASALNVQFAIEDPVGDLTPFAVR